MCLKDFEKPEKYFKDKKEIIVYKILNIDYTSQFEYYKWKEGLNISSRNSIEITEDEISNNEINNGFHFFLEKPKKCLYLCLYPCQYLYQCQYQNLYQCQYPLNKVVKFKVKIQDIIAIGKWEKVKSLVATKAIMIKDE